MRIGIDLGGTKIEIIALDSQGVECYRERIATPQGDYKQTITAIVELVKGAETHLESQLASQATVGMGIPGAISLQTGLVKNANSVCLIGKPLQKDLQQMLDREIRINNDANCLTVSEATDGAAADVEVVFGVIVGTGTGGGIAINKRVITGCNMIAGEWGHNPLPWPDHRDLPQITCYCGKEDCIETYLSGPGLLKRFRALVGDERAAPETVQELVDMAQQGNELAEISLQNYERQMAKSLAGVINILDPDKIVLAGGLSNIQRLYQNVPRIWSEYVFSDSVTTQLVAAKFGDSSGVRGAAWLWPQHDSGSFT